MLKWLRGMDAPKEIAVYRGVERYTQRKGRGTSAEN